MKMVIVLLLGVFPLGISCDNDLVPRRLLKCLWLIHLVDQVGRMMKLLRRRPYRRSRSSRRPNGMSWILWV